jgi:NDP-sugar pyrophosphorylase family protein
MTIPRALALVILPTKEHLLDRDVAGSPAGRFLLDRLAACQNVDLIVVSPAGQRPEWCASVTGGAEAWPVNGNIDDLSGRSILMCDARAWLSPAALAQLFLKIDQGSDPFAVRTTDAGGQETTLAAHLAPADRATMLRALVAMAPGSERELAVNLEVKTRVIDAASLDGSETPLFIDSVATLAAAERQVLRRRASDALQRGVRLRDPEQVYLRGDLACGSGVEIDIGVIIEGRVVLGDRVRIGAHSIVKDSAIGDDAVIHPFSIVEQSTVGASGFIGPYGRVRPGSAIGDRVQLGNYVEVKNSRIGAGSRINHHSFIGDAELAEQVTIGAGTITSNHDGAATQKTIIDRGAYIGSGCNLVAPVRIGERATVGAGSTITHDVPAERLTLARTRQTTIEHWRRRNPT